MNIYAGNLSWNLKDQDLQNLFAAHGEVSSAKIVTYKFTGRSKGFGFVEMPDEAAAKKAIAELDVGTVENRSISVTVAKPKEDRSSRGGKRNFNNRNSYNQNRY